MRLPLFLLFVLGCGLQLAAEEPLAVPVPPAPAPSYGEIFASPAAAPAYESLALPPIPQLSAPCPPAACPPAYCPPAPAPETMTSFVKRLEHAPAEKVAAQI